MKTLLIITASVLFFVGCAKGPEPTRVTIMPAPTGDGHVRAYSSFGLQSIAEQYLSEHHIVVPHDSVAITAQMDPKQPFVTVYFLKSDTPVHAVEIATDGTAVRDYPCQVIHVK